MGSKLTTLPPFSREMLRKCASGRRVTMTFEPKIIVYLESSQQYDSSSSLWQPKVSGQNMGRSPFIS